MWDNAQTLFLCLIYIYIYIYKSIKIVDLCYLYPFNLRILLMVVCLRAIWLWVSYTHIHMQELYTMCNADLGICLGLVHKNIGFVKKLTCIKYLSRVNILENLILCIDFFFLLKKKHSNKFDILCIDFFFLKKKKNSKENR